MRRRSFLKTAGGAGLGLMAARVLRPLPLRAQDKDTVEIALEAKPLGFAPKPGVAFDGLAFNGSIPGPLLRMRAGQKLKARFVNNSGGPGTIHWHGFVLPNDMDGADDVTQKPVPDGGEFLYEFTPNPPGLRWYHSHVMPQLAMGLFGAFVVEDPKDERADLELVLVFHDVPDPASYRLALAGKSEAAMDLPPGASEPGEMMIMTGMHMPDSGMDRGPGMGDMKMGDMATMGGMHDMGRMHGAGAGGAAAGDQGIAGHGMGDEVAYLAHCINGACYPAGAPVTVKVGDRVRLRVLNASPTVTHYIRLAGHRLKVTHSDGNPLPRPVEVDALRLGMAERCDAWFTVAKPGAWLLNALSSDPQRMEQALAIRTADKAGAEPERPPATLEGASYFDYAAAGMAMKMPLSLGKLAARYELVLGGGVFGDPRWTINGKTWPDTPRLDVRAGERILIRFRNETDMDHPMHLHGHIFELVEQGGMALHQPLRKDTALIPGNGGSAAWLVTADAPPGRWLLHCHNEIHMAGGMMTELRYV